MIDGDWKIRLESVEGIQEMEMDDLWQVLDEKLLLSFPLFSRRIEYLRLTQNRDELPSTFLQRIMVESKDKRMSECSEAGLAMSLFAACLPDTDLNSRIKDLLLESFRKKPNPKGIEKVLEKIQVL